MIMAKKSDFNTSRSVKDLQAEYGKMPPQAVDLEEAVLGALMLERDAFSIVGDLLEQDAFYKDAHQKIFRAIHKLFLNDDPVDLLTVSEALKQSGELEQVGGYYWLVVQHSSVEMQRKYLPLFLKAAERAQKGLNRLVQQRWAT